MTIPVMKPRLEILTSLEKSQVFYFGEMKSDAVKMSNGKTYTHPDLVNHPIYSKFVVLFEDEGICSGQVRQVIRID